MASVTARADQNAANFLVGLADNGSVHDVMVNETVKLEQQQHHQVNMVSEETVILEENTILKAEEQTNVIEDAPTEEAGDEPVIDIVVNNVVSSFSTRCHLNLKQIAMEGHNVEFKRASGMLNMKLRHPYTTASMWSSGKITCTGATSEDEARIAARRFARIIQRLGFNVRFSNFRVVNVLATCSLPFGIRITNFSREHRQNASYEPELHPGVTYRIKSPKATLKIFSTGSVTVTAPCVANIQTAIEHIFPLVYEHKSMELHKQSVSSQNAAAKFVKKRRVPGSSVPVMYKDENDFYNNEDDYSDSEDSFDSDESQD